MIELDNIHKSFGEVKALTDVSLCVSPGTIHGIVGENGAGKSTLMKVLTGFLRRTSGQIKIEGSPLELQDPGEAIAKGVGMLYQEPLDFPQLTILENFMGGGGCFSQKSERIKLKELCKLFGFKLSPHVKVEELTVGERQQLELLRLIKNEVKILILDEPTTGISEVQQKLLFNALTSLRDRGATILMVSHKLAEIDLLCDEVTVLRNGRVVAHQKQPFNRDALLEKMFESRPEKPQAIPRKPGEKAVLEFTGVESTVGRSGLQKVSISIRTGEVVGMAGVDGSGQSVFLKIAQGLLKPAGGTVHRFGLPLIHSHKNQQQNSAFLPADRLAEGLFPELSIREHHLLARTKEFFMTSKSGLGQTEQAIKAYNIIGNPGTEVEELSGGNQQRVLLSLIPEGVKLILMENPTRGLDVQSSSWTWNQLHRRLPEDGAIIFASPDLEELMEQASRILVFYNGNIVLDSATETTSFQELALAITGQV